MKSFDFFSSLTCRLHLMFCFDSRNFHDTTTGQVWDNTLPLLVRHSISWGGPPHVPWPSHWFAQSGHPTTGTSSWATAQNQTHDERTRTWSDPPLQTHTQPAIFFVKNYLELIALCFTADFLDLQLSCYCSVSVQHMLNIHLWDACQDCEEHPAE